MQALNYLHAIQLIKILLLFRRAQVGEYSIKFPHRALNAKLILKPLKFKKYHFNPYTFPGSNRFLENLSKKRIQQVKNIQRILSRDTQISGKPDDIRLDEFSCNWFGS